MAKTARIGYLYKTLSTFRLSVITARNSVDSCWFPKQEVKLAKPRTKQKFFFVKLDFPGN